MSRGPGRIEVAIVEAIRAEPENALTVTELCRRIYGEMKKKHRVSVLRAMRSISANSGEFGLVLKQGVGAVVFNSGSLASRQMAEAKLETQHLLRRTRWSNGDGGYWLYRGRRHFSRGTFSYKKLTLDELEELVRAKLVVANEG